MESMEVRRPVVCLSDPSSSLSSSLTETRRYARSDALQELAGHGGVKDASLTIDGRQLPLGHGGRLHERKGIPKLRSSMAAAKGVGGKCRPLDPPESLPSAASSRLFILHRETISTLNQALEMCFLG